VTDEIGQFVLVYILPGVAKGWAVLVAGTAEVSDVSSTSLTASKLELERIATSIVPRFRLFMLFGKSPGLMSMATGKTGDAPSTVISVMENWSNGNPKN
jgi:hypothetical protein